MKDEFSLEGKRALITGAGRGMGRSMALAMARHGADVVVAARTRGEVEAVAAEIKELGRRGFALTIDLMKLQDIEPMVKEAAKLLGGIDILVNNAGGSLATNPADLVKSLQENLTLNLVQVACAIEQSKYVNSLQIFHDNPGDLPESYVFVPSLRRSIRLTTAARCSPLVGSDSTQDDERSMNVQPPIFKSQFVGYKNLLVGYPVAGYTNISNYYRPLYFPGPQAVVWQLRPVAVLDIRRVPSLSAGYCYDSRMAYIDKQTWQPVWMDLYDVALHLWKIGPSIYRPMPIPGTNGDVATGVGGPGDGVYTFWDVQNNHPTLDIQSGGQINQDAKAYDDYVRWGPRVAWTR